ncbi:MAG: DEAD/DEAH box helicase [Acidobacteriota bacterium]|nr:DEAD/DEAH box helicase [Acidobacteriota bacterium]
MATLEEIEARVGDAIRPGFRGGLLAQGHARSIVWREGELPENAPRFSRLLTYDLLSYGFSLLRDGLNILDLEGSEETARAAFQNAAWAIEAVVVNGEETAERDFYRFVAGASYHLARYSARAFSLLVETTKNANLTSPERCLALLIVRSLDELEKLIRSYKSRSIGNDEELIARLAAVEGDASEEALDVVATALEDGFVSAIATALLGFERGDGELLDAARARLELGMSCSAESNLVNQWWCHRLAKFLLEDLWGVSLHKRLPLQSSDVPLEAWSNLRELFIASLYRRSRAEVELWPSQLKAADKALDSGESMVVSLPTSAGKTRIAELCILRTLARGQRVVFVTPLRALSAQTEASLERTFRPLGKTVSSLYGGIGATGVDESLLRRQDIVVSTPEKLDFALRNEPSLIDDVGLIVLDEGHMIGLGEREVRYEIQVQLLLRRSDAAERRVVCLSAVLPANEDADDFISWLTGESAGDGSVRMDWRPTRLSFGLVQWLGTHARLEFTVDPERAFVPRLFTSRVPPVGKRRKPFPRDQREFCLATAWALVEDGHTVLIYCPLRKSVEPFARAIRDLHRRGALDSVLSEDPAALQSALAIGREWLGEESALLYCLRLGVAVHHGALPTPYRREIERLLREGVLKVTISSPTLAQGLNLTASALVFHGVRRGPKLVDAKEFQNVAGRAGRAFVDLEGQVLYPMFDNEVNRRRDWSELAEQSADLGIESGLVLLVKHLLRRMIRKHSIEDASTLVEYVTNASHWEFAELPGENEGEQRREEKRWNGLVRALDTSILGLLGEDYIPDNEIEQRLDEVLQSSLWARSLARKSEQMQALLKLGLAGRALVVFRGTTSSQRKAYFLAGVGLEAGAFLDSNAEQLRGLLAQANECISAGEDEDAVAAIQQFAEVVFEIRPFTPDPMPSTWRSVLAAWLKGQALGLAADPQDPEVLRFVEDGLTFRLAWAMEAVRVHGLAAATEATAGNQFKHLDQDFAASAAETGTLSVPAAVLMKTGFGSRSGAIAAVLVGEADFDSMQGLLKWVRSDVVVRQAQDAEWPTPETHELWMRFSAGLARARRRTWRRSETNVQVDWFDPDSRQATLPVRLTPTTQTCEVRSPSFRLLGEADLNLPESLEGVLHGTISKDGAAVELRYLGPERPFM